MSSFNGLFKKKEILTLEDGTDRLFRNVEFEPTRSVINQKMGEIRSRCVSIFVVSRECARSLCVLWTEIWI
jgi:hypothetical protein